MEKWNRKNVRKNPLLKEAYGPLTLKDRWSDGSLRMTLKSEDSPSSMDKQKKAHGDG